MNVIAHCLLRGSFRSVPDFVLDQANFGPRCRQHMRRAPRIVAPMQIEIKMKATSIACGAAGATRRGRKIAIPPAAATRPIPIVVAGAILALTWVKPRPVLGFHRIRPLRR
jgi:hypothetical protein